MPLTAGVNGNNELTIGGITARELADKFGTPLWIICQETVEKCCADVMEGLSHYSGEYLPCYAGKAFLCQAMVRLIEKAGFGLDVVSEGELVTALSVNMNTENIFLHGNNKTDSELNLAIEHKINVVVDNLEDLEKLVQLRQGHKDSAIKNSATPVLLRIIPGIDLDTHDHIKTGHDTSKFGIPLDRLHDIVKYCQDKKELKLLGLHAHIGSQAMELEPFGEVVEIFADIYKEIKEKFALSLSHLDVGGGLGIAYTENDQPIGLYEWTKYLAQAVEKSFTSRSLKLPHLSIEPGRSLIGTAGVTLYRVGRTKELAQIRYLSVDGGMADNPRPITYQAQYTARVANRMAHDSTGREGLAKNWSIVGRYCESGDIIVEEALLDVEVGDLIAIFATGAYNYSMASNYNRTTKPTCVLVKDQCAEPIIQGETNLDLLRHDRLASWL